MKSVVVIGAGVAGCAAAATALELGYEVEVIEAGPVTEPPERIRSADLHQASLETDWWWPGPELAGRGLGGGSAVNGMVLQTSVQMGRNSATEPEEVWAMAALSRSRSISALGQKLAGRARFSFSVPMLSIDNGRRWTAADAWLKPDQRLRISGEQEVTASDIESITEDGRRVLVAAGALRSPALVKVEPKPALNHRSAVVGFEVPDEFRLTDPLAPVAGTVFRREDIQYLLMDRAGTDPSRGALIVSAMKDDPDGTLLAQGIEWAPRLLDHAGLVGELMPGPAPVAHYCCTLTDLKTPAPVIDASTLPDLPRVNPVIIVAAHARRETLRLLGG